MIAAHDTFEPSYDESERFWQHELPHARRAGRDQLQSACVMHGGHSPTSLSVNITLGLAHCFTKCKRGWGMHSWAMERHGLSSADAWEYVHRIIGRTPAASSGWSLPLRAPYEVTDDAFALQTLAESIMKRANLLSEQQTQLRRKVEPNAPAMRFEPTAIYPYASIGAVKVRYQHGSTKSMSWFQQSERKGWKWKLDGRAAGLYRADRLTRGGIVIIANGEKAVDRIDAAGWPATATCIPNGEQSRWSDAFTPHFKLAERVYIPMDNDPAGQAFGREAAGALVAAGIEACYVEVPGEPKSDLWDFIEHGGTWEEFLGLTGKAVKGSPEHYTKVLKGRASSSKVTPISGPPLPGNGDGPPAPPSEPPSGGVEGPDLREFELTDTGNCERLFRVVGTNSLYISRSREWIHYDEGKGIWILDNPNDGLIAEHAVKAMRLTELQAEPGGVLAKFARGSRNMAKLSAMLRRAQQDPAHQIDPATFDANPALIPHQGGVFDLITGTNRKGRREDYIQRVFPYRYDPALPEPKLFLQTVYRLMGWRDDLGDNEREQVYERVQYLQLAYGYCLTGYTHEKVFFISHGANPNCGKSVLRSVLNGIMGEGIYAQTVNPRIFCVDGNIGDSNKQSEMARCCGARIIQAAEPHKRHALDEAFLRELTQGTQYISTAQKHQPTFSYLPQFKVWLETNIVPAFDATDIAFLSRPHLIHHGVQIPKDEQDPKLVEKLLASEGNEIFSWMVAGAIRWLKEGLHPPPDIGHSLALMRAENLEDDELDPFLQKHFDRGRVLSCTYQECLDLYRRWCREERIVQRYGHKTLGPRLEAREGITRSRKHEKAPWRVLGLCPKDRPAAPVTGKDAAIPEEDD